MVQRDAANRDVTVRDVVTRHKPGLQGRRKLRIAMSRGITSCFTMSRRIMSRCTDARC